MSDRPDLPPDMPEPDRVPDGVPGDVPDSPLPDVPMEIPTPMTMASLQQAQARGK